MYNSCRFVLSLLVVAVCCTVQVQAQSKGLPGVMEKNGSYLFTALKMSPADQAALMDLLKGSDASFSLSVNTARNDQSYGRLSGVNLKVKEIAGNKLTSQATTTCHNVSTDNNCFQLNTVADLKALKPETQAQVKALISKYMR